MTVALHGNLRDFGMGEVFQLIGQQRKSGVLEVGGSGGRVELWFDEGRIVSAMPVQAGHDQAALGEMLVRCGLLTRERLAELETEREPALCSLSQLLVDREVLDADEIEEIENLLTRDTIFDLLRWTDGSFGFEARAARHARDPEALLGAEQVLMDGLRMVDEWRTFAAAVPSEQTVFRRVKSFDDYRRSREEADAERLAREERIFLLIDGRSSVRRVIDLSRLGTFEGTRVLAQLRAARLIEPAAPAGARDKRRARAREPVRRGRRATATLLGLAVLAGLAVATHVRWPEAAGTAPGRVERDALAEARLRYETRAARHLLEASRFGLGRAPHGFAELERWGGGALTFSPAGPYYYQSGGPGPLLLAPEH